MDGPTEARRSQDAIKHIKLELMIMDGLGEMGRLWMAPGKWDGAGKWAASAEGYEFLQVSRRSLTGTPAKSLLVRV